MAPIQIVGWIKRTYPKPAVNSEWLDACCAWISDEMHINPAMQTEAFIAEVENQLLESDLRDSMETGTGLPRNALAMNNQRIRGSPHILVEVTAITEIGHSAFSLHNVRQARIERADLAGLAQEEGVEDDEGPIPNYPRSMLRLELSDGTVTMPAIEYRSIPALKLDETPLGCKLLLKDVLVRRGILFLEPSGIVLKGHRTGDRDEFRDRDFVHGLLRRVMKPVPQEQQADENINLPPLTRHGAPSGPTAPQAQLRPPLQEIPDPLESRDDGMEMDDEADLPRKRRIPNPHPPSPTRVSSAASSTKTLVASHYFGSGSSSAVTNTAIEATTRRLARVLSPVRGDPLDITDSSMEDPGPFSARTGTAEKHLPQAFRSTTNAACTQAKKISYEEFEFDDDDDVMDAAFLDEIAKVEREALEGQSVSQAVTGSRAAGTGDSIAETTRVSNRPAVRHGIVSPSSIVGSPFGAQRSGFADTQVGPPPPPPHHATITPATAIHERTGVNAQDVITIEDDEDDDKENVPVPKRRVRRRVSIPLSEDVIDISD